MSPYEYKKPIDDRINRQTTIDFAYAEEQKMVANQYNVLHPEKIEKREDGIWYMVGSDQTVKEWDEFHNTKDLPYYSGQKH